MIRSSMDRVLEAESGGDDVQLSITPSSAPTEHRKTSAPSRGAELPS